MHLTFLQQLYAHMEWSDALLWQTVIAEDAASRDDFVLDSLVHLHLVQRAYLNVWRGDSIPSVSRDDFAEPAEIREWARPFYAEARAFQDELTEERLGEVIPIPWTKFIEKEIGATHSPANLGEMVFQVAAHSVHHRAQISRRVREVGGTPKMLDYVVWVWRGCPSAEWV
jgi:uncharacterized damage-inducible protein DinB